MFEKTVLQRLAARELSVKGCFAGGGDKTVFYVGRFLRINNLPDAVRDDVVETILEIFPDISLAEDIID